MLLVYVHFLPVFVQRVPSRFIRITRRVIVLVYLFFFLILVFFIQFVSTPALSLSMISAISLVNTRLLHSFQLDVASLSVYSGATIGALFLVSRMLTSLSATHSRAAVCHPLFDGFLLLLLSFCDSSLFLHLRTYLFIYGIVYVTLYFVSSDLHPFLSVLFFSIHYKYPFRVFDFISLTKSSTT